MNYYYVSYDKNSQKIVDVIASTETYDSQFYQQNNCYLLEVTQDFYIALKKNGFGGYVENNLAYVIDKPPFPYAVFNIKTKSWELDTKSQLENETDIARDRRNAELIALDAITTNSLRWNELTPEKQNEYNLYRNALLNVPQQDGFPLNIVWPTQPT